MDEKIEVVQSKLVAIQSKLRGLFLLISARELCLYRYSLQLKTVMEAAHYRF